MNQDAQTASTQICTCLSSSNFYLMNSQKLMRSIFNLNNDRSLYALIYNRSCAVAVFLPCTCMPLHSVLIAPMDVNMELYICFCVVSDHPRPLSANVTLFGSLLKRLQIVRTVRIPFKP